MSKALVRNVCAAPRHELGIDAQQYRRQCRAHRRVCDPHLSEHEAIISALDRLIDQLNAYIDRTLRLLERHCRALSYVLRPVRDLSIDQIGQPVKIGIDTDIDHQQFRTRKVRKHVRGGSARLEIIAHHLSGRLFAIRAHIFLRHAVVGTADYRALLYLPKIGVAFGHLR